MKGSFREERIEKKQTNRVEYIFMQMFLGIDYTKQQTAQPASLHYHKLNPIEPTTASEKEREEEEKETS